MSKRVLLTGATGFVGANLARRLIREGHDVTALVREGHKPWRLNGLDDMRLVTADLGDARQVDKAVGLMRPDWVFHLAAHGAYAHEHDWRQMVATNIIGTANLLRACIEVGFESFVNTGSSSEYGFKQDAPNELALPEPNSDYAVTKVAATLHCGLIGRSLGVPIRTLRLYSVYGPWEEPSRLLPTLIIEGLRNRLPPLVDRHIARDFVFVDDVCDAYLLTASSTNAAFDAVFNVGTGVQTSLETVVGHARRLLHISAEPQWSSMPNRSWDTTCWVADSRKIASELGWSPRHSLEAGLSALIDWFCSNPAQRALYEGALSAPRA